MATLHLFTNIPPIFNICYYIDKLLFKKIKIIIIIIRMSKKIYKFVESNHDPT